jgi:chromosome segregation ATPase
LQSQYEEAMTMLARAADEAMASEREITAAQSDLEGAHREVEQMGPEVDAHLEELARELTAARAATLQVRTAPV